VKESDIRRELARIRQQIAKRDNSGLVVWVIPSTLACSQRPLRDHPRFGGRSPLPPEARSEIVRWVNKIKTLGIRSIICLLEPDQLDRYYVRGGLNLHQSGLLGYYRKHGFSVSHIPMTDFKRPTNALMNRVLNKFNILLKPVLIQCSAAIDRTTPVAAFIAAKYKPTAPGDISEMNPHR
jgi:hypothetical protein